MKNWLQTLCVTLAIAGSAFSAAPKETVVYSFQGGTDGSYPYAGLLAGKGGTLYGTTSAGGGGTCTGGCGTVFQLTPPAATGGAWTETVLYRFTGGSDGATPWAGLILDGTGNLYGATLAGGNTSCRTGCGVVFELSPPASIGGSWTQSVLYSFKGVRSGDGNGPEGTLIFDASGRLYGTTYAGGIACSDSAPTGCGTVFQLTPPSSSGGAWTETLIYKFDPSFAGGPSGALLLDSKGNLYGTAVNDGVYGEGTAYKLAPQSSGGWHRTVLHAFGGSSTDGGYVSAGLTVGKGGALYGATEGYGGQVGDGGTVFQLTPPASSGAGWTETVLYVFPGDNGYTRGPFGSLLAGPSGVLFGMTPSGGGGSCSVLGWLGCGTVFELTPPASMGGAWTHTTLHSFSGGTDGAVPYSGVIFGLGNALFGTTYGGGTGTCSQQSPAGCGTVFTIAP